MNVLIYGATGMVGQGVLRECLLAADVTRVQTVGRAGTGIRHQKLTELVVPNMFDHRAFSAQLSGYDACFFCLGVSSAGRSEADYTRLTYDLTLACAHPLARLNPDMTFVYVSGAGTDRTEGGKSMWARVKGRTENALLRLPFKAVYMFRPGLIRPLHGIRSKTPLYRITYWLAAPFLPLLQRLFPAQVTDTEQVGLAMLVVARHGAPKVILESRDIVALR